MYEQTGIRDDGRLVGELRPMGLRPRATVQTGTRTGDRLSITVTKAPRSELRSEADATLFARMRSVLRGRLSAF